MTTLKNKIIFITGASSGIGEACARAFAEQGARVILSARRVDRLQDLALEFKTKWDCESIVLPLDVRDKKLVQKQIESLPKEWQDIDVLINNAGLALDTLALQDGIIEHWDIMIDTNIKGLLYVTKCVLPGMLQRGRGHIVNLGSIAGHECYPNGNVYCATKFAVHAISKSMRMDLLGSPIRVTEIAPGHTDTEFAEIRWNDKDKAKAFYEEIDSLHAQDIADTILFSVTRPPHVNIEQMIVLATVQASANHMYKHPKVTE